MTWLASTLLALAMMASAAAKAESIPGSFADLAEKLLPAVVNISTTQVIKRRNGPTMPQLPPGSPFEDFFREFMDRNQQQGEPRRQRNATSLGSGFVVDIGKNGDAYVITNNHVIEGADEITVILQDNDRLKAELVGRDEKN
jgi:serine protease Do